MKYWIKEWIERNHWLRNNTHFPSFQNIPQNMTVKEVKKGWHNKRRLEMIDTFKDIFEKLNSQISKAEKFQLEYENNSGLENVTFNYDFGVEAPFRPHEINKPRYLSYNDSDEKYYHTEDFEYEGDYLIPKIFSFINKFPYKPLNIPIRIALPKTCYIKIDEINESISLDHQYYQNSVNSSKKELQKYKDWENDEFPKILKKFENTKKSLSKKMKEYEVGIKNLDKELIQERVLLHLNQNEIYPYFVENKNVEVDIQTPSLLVNLYLVNFDYEWFLELKSGDDKNLTDKQKKEILGKFIKFLSIRTLYAVSQILVNSPIDLICVNIHQKWFDRAIGIENDGVTSSLQVYKNEISKIDLTKIDINKSYNHFKGILTPSVSTPTKIRPIMELNTSDRRIIETDDVIGRTSENQNLALMDWEDFEHLVGQLFELEFSADGSEIKVTQSSRDKGVDAIMFDPNPLKGGKYILQAKRYTNVVGVSAVRDLYGTIMNEGANRGILITTAYYGPDAYEFAKDKPISLVDGPNLINLLNKHKMNFKIDLEEARNILNAKK